jgi:hypothetical protein
LSRLTTFRASNRRYGWITAVAVFPLIFSAYGSSDLALHRVGLTFLTIYSGVILLALVAFLRGEPRLILTDAGFRRKWFFLSRDYLWADCTDISRLSIQGRDAIQIELKGGRRVVVPAIYDSLDNLFDAMNAGYQRVGLVPRGVE